LVERNAQLTEPAAERAKVEKMAEYVALADERPWWKTVRQMSRRAVAGQPRSDSAYRSHRGRALASTSLGGGGAPHRVV
jgi:hypothetical protein